MTERRRRDIDWQDLRTFLALGRHRSLSGAARALQVDHATVARRIRALEAALGEKLVERRPDGYVLTPTGEAALGRAAEMETAALALKHPRRAGGGSGVRGKVRVNAPPALTQAFLLAHLAQIHEIHPGVDIDLATNLRAVSLERHEADIAIRLGPFADSGLVARPLGRMAFGFYGTAATCDAVERGEAAAFIGFDEGNADIPESAWFARQFPQARVCFRAENHVLQAIAARSGLGLALVPHYIGRQLPELRACALGPVPPPREISALIRPQDRAADAIRAVISHLADAFRRSERQFVA